MGKYSVRSARVEQDQWQKVQNITGLTFSAFVSGSMDFVVRVQEQILKMVDYLDTIFPSLTGYNLPPAGDIHVSFAWNTLYFNLHDFISTYLTRFAGMPKDNQIYGAGYFWGSLLCHRIRRLLFRDQTASRYLKEKPESISKNFAEFTGALEFDLTPESPEARKIMNVFKKLQKTPTPFDPKNRMAWIAVIDAVLLGIGGMEISEEELSSLAKWSPAYDMCCHSPAVGYAVDGDFPEVTIRSWCGDPEHRPKGETVDSLIAARFVSLVRRKS